MPLEAPPVEANPRPALAIAPLVRLDTATLERRTWPPSESEHRPDPERAAAHLPAVLTCTTCGEETAPPLHDDGAAAPPCEDCGGTRYYRDPFWPPFRPRVRVADVRARAADLLDQRGVFSRVVLLPADDPTIDPDLGVTPEIRHAWLETARARGARWLLEPVLDECRVELVEKNGLHALKVANLIVCSILIFPAVDPTNWFIPGEDYGVVQRLSWRVTDLEAGLTSEGQRDLTTKASFNELGPGPSREFYVVGFLRAPGCLDEEAWSEIADQLTPTAAEDLARALVGAAESSAR